MKCLQEILSLIGKLSRTLKHVCTTGKSVVFDGVIYSNYNVAELISAREIFLAERPAANSDITEHKSYVRVLLQWAMKFFFGSHHLRQRGFAGACLRQIHTLSKGKSVVTWASPHIAKNLVYKGIKPQITSPTLASQGHASRFLRIVEQCHKEWTRRVKWKPLLDLMAGYFVMNGEMFKLCCMRPVLIIEGSVPSTVWGLQQHFPCTSLRCQKRNNTNSKLHGKQKGIQ